METNKVNCKNCEQPYEKGFAFCPHCGQKTNDELTIGVLFYNTISNYFSFDARFLKSFIPLMFRPGYLAEKFLIGKRLLYLHPAQMYLFVSVIFFFAISFSVRKTASELDTALKAELKDKTLQDSPLVNITPLDTTKINQILEPIKQNQKALGLKDEDLKIADSVIRSEASKPKNIKTNFDFNQKTIDSLLAIGADNNTVYKAMGMKDDAGYFTRKFYGQMLKFYKERGAGALMHTFFDTIPIAMFFLLPLFALILKLFYYRKGRYAHHLVFSFYFFSFLFTVFSIIFGINAIWDIPDWIDWLIALSTFFYLVVAVTRFYKQHWFVSFVKSNIISFIFLAMVMPFAFGILMLFSFLFY